ncbi:hypothetical protein J1N35_026414, partial [Gossypium stocksii]
EPPLRPIPNLGGLTPNDEFNMPLVVIRFGWDTISITSSIKWWITHRRPLDRHMVLTVRAFHLVDPVALRSATLVWHDNLASLAKPFLVVNFGRATSSW